MWIKIQTQNIGPVQIYQETKEIIINFIQVIAFVVFILLDEFYSMPIIVCPFLGNEK